VYDPPVRVPPKVNVIGGHHIVEHQQTTALLGFEKSVQVTAPVARKLQEQCLVVAAVREVPDVTGQNTAMGTGHRVCLRACVSCSKRHRYAYGPLRVCDRI